jgi:hypothetical protein
VATKSPDLYFRLTDITVDSILADAVNHQFRRLFAVRSVENYGLIKIDVFLGEFEIVDHQFQIGIPMLRIGFAQANADWPLALELTIFVDIELVVTAFTFFLEHNQIVMGASNGAL